MQLSNIPGKLVLPFANAGGKSTIPVASQIGITAGAASLTDGFPPLTRTPVAAGGVPPSGLDMNGILYEMSAIVRWANAGGGYPYDSAFATDTNVGGYPKGARIMRSDGTGYWFNTVENNVTDPESAGAAAAGWVPDYQSGATSVAMSGSSVTLTPNQYGKPLIVITGTLSANLNLIFPALAQGWTVINNATGGYSITANTASGSGVTLGTISQIVGDGTNMYAANPDSVQIVNNVATLRNIAPSLSRRMQTRGYYTDGDGGSAQYFPKVGAASGTYVHNGSTVIVPNGGDGSSAWLLDYDGFVSLRQGGAKGDNSTDDATSINNLAAVLRAAGVALLIDQGVFKVASSLNFTGLFVFGLGFGGKIQATNAQFDVITTSGNSTFKDFALNGGWDGSTAGLTGDGIVVSNISPAYPYNVHIDNVQVQYCKRNGIYINRGGYSSLRNIKCNASGLNALEMYGVSGADTTTTVAVDGTSTFSDTPNGYGVKLTNCINVQLKGVICEHTKGIEIAGSDNRNISVNGVYQENIIGSTNFITLTGSGIGLSILGCFGVGYSIPYSASWSNVIIDGNAGFAGNGLYGNGRILTADGGEQTTTTAGNVATCFLTVPPGTWLFEGTCQTENAYGGTADRMGLRLSTNAADSAMVTATNANFVPDIDMRGDPLNGVNLRTRVSTVYNNTTGANQTMYLIAYIGRTAGTVAFRGYIRATKLD